MGTKEDEAADFFEKMLSGNVNFVDVDDENPDIMNKFDSAANNIQLSPEMERDYQEYIRSTGKRGYPPVNRTEFLAIINSAGAKKER
jgi:hypothetical protein